MKRKLIHFSVGLCLCCAVIAVDIAAVIIEPIILVVSISQLAFPLIGVALISFICIVDAIRMLVRGDESYTGRAFLFLRRSKLINIPFFILNILMWTALLLASFNPFLIWLWLFVPLAVAYAYLLLLATSSYAIVHLILLCRKGKISKGKCVLHIFLQLIFVADVIDILFLRRMEKQMVTKSQGQGDALPVPVPKTRQKKSLLVHEIIFAYLFLIPVFFSVLWGSNGIFGAFLTQVIWPGLIYPVISLLCLLDSIKDSRKDCQTTSQTATRSVSETTDQAVSKQTRLKRVLSAKILSIPWYAGVVFIGIKIVQLPATPKDIVTVTALFILLGIAACAHILASSSYGVAYLHILLKEGRIKRSSYILHSILLFIPVVDVIDIVLIRLQKL